MQEFSFYFYCTYNLILSRMQIVYKRNLTLPIKEIQQDQPFRVLYNYRKTKMLKKARQLRKEKIERIKKERMSFVEEVRREKQEIINKNMLEDDGQWDLCYENFKKLKEIQEDNNSTNQEVKLPSKTLDQLKMDLAYQIPYYEKTNLYVEGFVKFEYFC